MHSNNDGCCGTADTLLIYTHAQRDGNRGVGFLIHYYCVYIPFTYIRYTIHVFNIPPHRVEKEEKFTPAAHTSHTVVTIHISLIPKCYFLFSSVTRKWFQVVFATLTFFCLLLSAVQNSGGIGMRCWVSQLFYVCLTLFFCTHLL